MTRKDYRAIAEAIKAEVEYWEGKNPQVTSALDSVAVKIANVMQNDNVRFDDTKFYIACGV